MRAMLATAAVLDFAEKAGRALNTAGRTVPGVFGALLVAYGLYQAWHPLGFITAGAFLLVLDHRAR